MCLDDGWRACLSPRLPGMIPTKKRKVDGALQREVAAALMVRRVISPLSSSNPSNTLSISKPTMKTSPQSSARILSHSADVFSQARQVFLWICLLYCLAGASVWADTSAPSYAGSTITSNGFVYTWDSATEENLEDSNGYYISHVDTYTGSAGSVSVQGKLYNSSLAVVSSSSGSSGYIQNGTYYENGRVAHTSGTSLSVNGFSYSWQSGADYFSLNTWNWQLQLSHSTDTYGTNASPARFFTTSIDALGNGTISGSESGVVFQAGFYFNGPSTGSGYGPSSYSLFGSTYSTNNISYSTYWDSSSIQRLCVTEFYTESNAGSFSVTYRNDTGGWLGWTGAFSGNDPIVGEFSGNYSYWGNLAFSISRTAPSFAARQLWTNSTVVSWQPGFITNTDGDVTDVYTVLDAEGNTVTLSISGNLPNYIKTPGYSPSVEVTVTGSGTVLAHAVGVYVKGTPNYFNISGWYVGVAQYSRNTPLYVPGNPYLWINGSRYAFQGGTDDGGGNGIDTYSNGMVGALTILGNSTSNTKVVKVSYHSGNFSGTFDAGGSPAFAVADLIIGTSALGSPGFWVGGTLYQRSADNDTLYVNPAFQTLSIDYGNGNVLLAGADALSSFSAQFPLGSAGVFTCVRDNGLLLPACPANANGSLQLYTTDAPPDFPPAIALADNGIWKFLGVATEDGNSSGQAAYYGNAATAGPGALLLKIRSSDGTVTLTDYIGHTSTTGTYNAQTHLFQSDVAQLPMPMYGTNPLSNNVRWGWLIPTGRPATVLVAGDVWGYAGTDVNGDHYAGYYTGQQLSFAAAAGRDGILNVILTDSTHPNTVTGNGTSYGIYYNNVFQMRNGSPVVLSGNDRGAETAPTGLSLSVTGADLDVLGNLFSLGSLKTNSNTVGLTLQFSDDGTTARLASSLSRVNAEWTWNHVTSNNAGTGVAMMKLDANNRLSLFDSTDPTKAAIILNPAGRSIFDKPVVIGPYPDTSIETVSGTDRTKGVFVVAAGNKHAPTGVVTPRNALRVLEDGTVLIQFSGDISMGEFTAGPQP